MVYGYLALKQFPKHETHVMGAEIRRSMLALQRLIITAFKRYHKKTTLTDMDIELTMLKRMIRTAKDMRYLDVCRIAVAIGTTRPMPGLEHSTSTTRARMRTAILVSVQLLITPEVPTSRGCASATLKRMLQPQRLLKH